MKKLLVLMFGVVTFMGCSGGDSGGGGDVQKDGKVMVDSSGNNVSRVYMDLNGNNQYDSGEPLASRITAEGDYFSYSIKVPNSNKSLKAEVTSGTSGTSSLSSAGSSYTLSSPAGQMLISPYTTMINNLMVSEGKTLTEAQSMVNSSTGRTDDFFSETTYENEEVQKTSKYIANSIRNALDSIGITGLTSEDLNSIIVAVTNAVMEALQDVIAAITGGTYDEDDKYAPADLDALAMLAQGMYVFEFDASGSDIDGLNIFGIKMVNGVFSMAGDYLDELNNNGNHVYNRNINLSKMVYDPYASVKVEESGVITVNMTQTRQLDNVVMSTPSNAQIHTMVPDLSSYTYSNFPRLNKTVNFSSAAKVITLDWIELDVDLTDPAVRASLDLDNSTDKIIYSNQPVCGASSNEQLVAMASTCGDFYGTVSTYNDIGGKPRVVVESTNSVGQGRIEVIWIENGKTYEVIFNEANTVVMHWFDKATMNEILEVYFSE